MNRKPVLANSSIWIDHIAGNPTLLAGLLRERRVAMHPIVMGEIAMGSLSNRQSFIHELKKLPQTQVSSNAEVMAMVEWQKLFSTGIGFADAHLLAATKMTDHATLMTKHNKFHAQAERLGVAYTP
jgi:predicted nucleic acid-binding protein